MISANISGISTKDYLNSLKYVLDFLKDSYNYVFLDAQAGSDIYAERAISVSNQVVIVSEYDPVSLAGVKRLESIFSSIMSFDKEGILYNKMLPEFIKDLGTTRMRMTEKILPPIPWDKDVIIAFSERKLALDTEKGNPYTLAIMRAVSSLLGEELKQQINNWKTEKADSIREPIEKQSADTKRDLDAFEKLLIEQQYKLRMLRQRLRNQTILYIFTLGFLIVYTVGIFYTGLKLPIFDLTIIGQLLRP